MRIFALLLFFTVLFSCAFADTLSVEATSNLSTNYSFCVNSYSESGSASDECMNFVDNAKDVSKILNIIYVDDIDDYEYLTCVRNEIDSGALNYVTIRDNCYRSIMQKNKLKQVLSLFKVNCQYDFNSSVDKNGVYDLTVSCKSILPSLCYKTDVDLVKKGIDSYELQPIISQSTNNCFDLAKIDLIEKKFELNKRETVLTIVPYVLQDKDGNTLPIESVFEQDSIVGNLQNMQDIEKTYYGCLINYNLHYNYNSENLFLDNRTLTNAELIDTCRTKVTYAYSVYLDSVSKERAELKQKMQSSFNEFLMQNNLDEMSTFLESILRTYEDYKKVNAKLTTSENSLPLNLTLDTLIKRLETSIAGKEPVERKEKISEFKVTLLNDLRDKIEVTRKNNLPKVIAFFNDEIATLQTDEMKAIFSSLKLEIILDLISDKNVLDLTDVDFVLTPGGVKLGDLSFVPDKEIVVHSDHNYRFNLSGGEIIFSEDEIYDINTNLPLTVLGNRLYVSDKNIIVLTELERKELPGVVKGVVLIKDKDGFLVYGVDRVLNGYFLGLFGVSENVVEKYNAESGVLFEIKKPWWDFLIVYPKSLKQSVTKSG